MRLASLSVFLIAKSEANERARVAAALQVQQEWQAEKDRVVQARHLPAAPRARKRSGIRHAGRRNRVRQRRGLEPSRGKRAAGAAGRQPARSARRDSARGASDALCRAPAGGSLAAAGEARRKLA